MAVPPDWSDAPDQQLDQLAAQKLTARVLPNAKEPTELELLGNCPRCNHQTRWTAALRGVVGQTPKPADSAAAEAQAFREERGLPANKKVDRVTAQCGCGYEHDKRPNGEVGCGAPFSVVVSWTSGDAKSRAAEVHGTDETTTRFDLDDARELQGLRKTELADVRKSAENWRTGLAALLAVLTATLFIKGKSSIDDIDPGGWRWAVIVPLLLAGIAATFGAYRAIRAAYGVPRDEWVDVDKGLQKHGSLSAWRHAFAVTTVNDLRLAKVMTVLSLGLVGLAIFLTWVAPGPPPPAFVSATFSSAPDKPICGELTRADSGKVVIKKDDEHRVEKPFSELIALKVVDECK
jgi:hypothetical protein